jgi:putative membrane protein
LPDRDGADGRCVTVVALLISTIVLRPYVFAFFAAFLLGSIVNFGWRTTLLYMTLTYVVIFVCEWSSIHNGFPFGLYHYDGATRGREIWIAGVPLFDPLSFTFLGFASYATALLLAAPLYRNGFDMRLLDTRALRRSLRVWLMAALFMTMVDMVVDPLSVRGDRWFLGRIFWYDRPGAHFGVPISNYLGWFLMAAIATAIFQALDSWISHEREKPRGVVPGWPSRALLGPLLYCGMVGFGVTMLFRIGATEIGWASLFIYLPFVGFAMHLLTRPESYAVPGAILRHLADFPYDATCISVTPEPAVTAPHSNVKPMRRKVRRPR